MAQTSFPRNDAKWLAPLGCFWIIFGVVFFAGIIVVSVMAVLKSTDVYQEALSRASQNQTVTQKIGTPVEAGWYVTGSLKIFGGGYGRAALTIPIHGSRGDATIYTWANQMGGGWKIFFLEVIFDGTGERVKILE